VLAPRPWALRGEVGAKDRPLNSALEVDLDFDRGVRPPAEPTPETASAIETLIRERILSRRWDDVLAAATPVAREARTGIEIEEARSARGLGELYADEYRGAAGAGAEGANPNSAAGREAALREEVRAAYRGLCSRLDALAGHRRAPPPGEAGDADAPEASASRRRGDVHAAALEDAGPTLASDAAAAAPGEIYRSVAARGGGGGGADGDLVDDAEMTREERRRRRARRKRAGRAAKMEENRRDPEAAGRRSEAAERRRVQDEAERGNAAGRKNTSSKMFGDMQIAMEDASAGGKKIKEARSVGTPGRL